MLDNILDICLKIDIVKKFLNYIEKKNFQNLRKNQRKCKKRVFRNSIHNNYKCNKTFKTIWTSFWYRKTKL